MYTNTAAVNEETWKIERTIIHDFDTHKHIIKGYINVTIHAYKSGEHATDPADLAYELNQRHNCSTIKNHEGEYGVEIKAAARMIKQIATQLCEHGYEITWID